MIDYSMLLNRSVSQPTVKDFDVVIGFINVIIEPVLVAPRTIFHTLPSGGSVSTIFKPEDASASRCFSRAAAFLSCPNRYKSPRANANKNSGKLDRNLMVRDHEFEHLTHNLHCDFGSVFSTIEIPRL